MSHKIRVKGYTWIEGRLFTEEHMLNSLDAAIAHARSRGPHAFKVLDVETNEVLFTEIITDTGNQLPEYA